MILTESSSVHFTDFKDGKDARNTWELRETKILRNTKLLVQIIHVSRFHFSNSTRRNMNFHKSIRISVYPRSSHSETTNIWSLLRGAAVSLYNSAVKDRHGVVRYDRSVTAYLIWQGNNNDSRGRKKKKKRNKRKETRKKNHHRSTYILRDSTY